MANGFWPSRHPEYGPGESATGSPNGSMLEGPDVADFMVSLILRLADWFG
jgi:hypothetical protein